MAKNKQSIYPIGFSLLDALVASPDHPMPESIIRKQLNVIYMAIAEIEKGKAPTLSDLMIASDPVNMMDTLVSHMNWIEYPAENIKAGVQAIKASALRGHTTGNYRFDAVGMAAVRECAQAYAEALYIVPHRTMVHAYRFTMREIANAAQSKKSTIATIEIVEG